MLLTFVIASLGLRALACASKHNEPPSGATTGPDGVLDPDGSLLGGDGAVDPTGGDGAVNDGAVVAPTPPSYCQGLSLYLAYDQGVAPSFGGAATRQIGEVGTTTGRFGSAAEFRPDAAALDASMVFYDQVDGGPPIFAQSEGTIAYWLRARAPLDSNAAVARPLANAQLLTPGGPSVGYGSGTFGLFAQFIAGPLATLPVGQLTPYLRGNDFDHFVAEWRANDGGPDIVEVVVNGGTAEVFHDAGYDAASLDASPDDAGNYRLPYAVRRTGTMPPYAPFTSLRIGGNLTTAPTADVDEVAVWSRMLSRAEVLELYRATTSIRTACAIP